MLDEVCGKASLRVLFGVIGIFLFVVKFFLFFLVLCVFVGMKWVMDICRVKV